MNNRELELRKRLFGSKEYSSATHWMNMYEPKKLNELIHDAAGWDVESDLYLQLAQKCMNQSVLGVLGEEVKRMTEVCFINRLTREKVVSLATIMEEDGMRIEIAEGVEIRSNDWLIKQWDGLHSDEKPIYKTSHYPDF